MRTDHSKSGSSPSMPDSIPFSSDAAGEDTQAIPPDQKDDLDLTCLPESAEHVLDAIDQMSRQIHDLARELNCLGYFDEDDDGPRAA